MNENGRIEAIANAPAEPGDASILAAGRQVTLLHNVVNQLDAEAQALVSIFNIKFAAVPQSSSIQITTMIDLQQQWDAIKILCSTLSELVPSYRTELNPQLFSLGALVDKAVECKSSAKAQTFNIPFSLLKLVAASKRAVARSLEDMKGKVTEEDVKACLLAVNSSSVALQHQLIQKSKLKESGWDSSNMDILSETEMMSEMLRQSRKKLPLDHQPTLLDVTALGANQNSFRLRSVSDGVNPAVCLQNNLKTMRELREQLFQNDEAELGRPRLHSVDGGTIFEGSESKATNESFLARKKTLMNKSDKRKKDTTSSQTSDVSSNEASRDLYHLAESLDSQVVGSISSHLNRVKPPPIIVDSFAAGSPHSASTIHRGAFPKCSNNRLALIPINGMFSPCTIDLLEVTRFGRSNTKRHPYFKAFESQVVSRSHFEVWSEKDKAILEAGINYEENKVHIRDVGSNGGTFLNGTRLSETGKISDAYVLNTGDYLQIGRDFVSDSEPGITVQLDDVVAAAVSSLSAKQESTFLHWKMPLTVDKSMLIVEKKHRCVKLQVVRLTSDEDLLIGKQSSSAKIEVDGISPTTVEPLQKAHLSEEFSTKSNQIPGKGLNFNPLLIDTTILAPIASIFSAPPAVTEYQKQLEAQQRKIELQLEAQQEKIQRELKQLTSCLSASDMSPGALSIGGGTTGKRGVLGVDVEESQKNGRRRIKWTVVTCFIGSKIKKATFRAEGCDSDLFSIDLKNWEGKRTLQVTDLRPRFFATAELEITPKPQTPKEYLITGKSPMTHLITTLGTITQLSDIKLEVNPNQNDQQRYTLTGDFKDGKFIVVQRFAHSREQRLIGESFGRKLLRRSVREVRWGCEVEVEEGEGVGGNVLVDCSQLLISAVLFVHVGSCGV
ncbi:hypothetical protein HDU67_006259 [Dinochytrium kinnereticum]|nr:hypothetical protein HDU67_006259 [Dinochytrium kinnereticum]